MALGRFANLLSAIDELPQGLVGFDSLEKDEFIRKIPSILKDAYPMFIKILVVATEIDEKVLQEEVGVAECAELVSIVFEVNEVERIKNAFSAMVKSFKKPVAPEAVKALN